MPHAIVGEGVQIGGDRRRRGRWQRMGKGVQIGEHGVTRGEELAATVVELAQQRVVPAAERHGG